MADNSNDSSENGDQIPNNSPNFTRNNSMGLNDNDDELMQHDFGGSGENEDIKLCLRLITSAYDVRDYDLIDEIISDVVAKSNIPGMTKLHSVCGYGFSELVEKYLAKLKMDPDAECVFNELGAITPLHFCSGIGPDPISPDRDKCIELLVKYGADVNHPTTRLDTPLHWAAKISNVKICDTLIRNGANINALNSDLCTCAHGAAFYKNLDVLQLLIDSNVNTNIIDCSGKTVLHLLCKETLESNVKDTDYAEMLRNDDFDSMTKLAEEHKADTKDSTKKLIQIISSLLAKNRENINVKDTTGFTPVMYACEYGNMELLKLLIQYGGDVNIASDEGVTCLLLAIVNAEIDIVKCLIENGFDTKKENCSYLTDAAFLNDIDIVKLLLSVGFDVNETKQDENGAILNPLWAACEKGNFDIVKLLLDHGAHVIIRGDLNMTALHCVGMAQFENIDIAKLLVEHKCPINQRTEDAQETPFFLACNSGYKEVAAYLIELGVDPNDCSATTRTCFQQAVFKGFKEIIRLLIDNNYKLTTQDVNSAGLLVMDLYQDGDVDMLKYLLDKKVIDNAFLLQSIQTIPVIDGLNEDTIVARPNSLDELESFLNTKLTIKDD